MELLLIITATISIVVCAAALIDLIPIFLRWFSRIHIGKWNSSEEWNASVQKVLFQQLKKTPAVPVSGNTRFTIFERLKGTYKSENLQIWQQAALLLGTNDFCGSVEAEKLINNFIRSKIDPESGGWIRRCEKNEGAMLAYAILVSPLSDKQKIKPAMDQTAFILKAMAEKYGTVPYDTSIPNVAFVDSVGMICPFLIKYSMMYSDENALDIGRRQLMEYCEKGLHEEFNIPIHCFDKNTGAPLGIYGWGRGCGWLALGMMESYLSLPEASNNKAVNDLKSYIFKQMIRNADAILRFQTSDGAWCRQIQLPDSGESTATAMLGRFMNKMFILSGDTKYKSSAEKAKRFLVGCTRRNGILDYAQGDTGGIGFYSLRMDSLPAAQGFAAGLMRM